MFRKSVSPSVIFLFLYLLFVQLDFLRPFFNYNWFGLVTYLCLALLGLVLFRKDLREDWEHLDKKLGLVCLLGSLLVSLLLAFVLSSLSQILLVVIGNADYTLVNDSHIASLVAQVPMGFVLLVVVFCGPFVEELVFRFLVFRFLRQKLSLSLLLLVQAVLFGLIHVHVLRLPEFIAVLPHIGMGLIYGWVYIRCKSIWLPFGLHLLWNAIGILGIF